MKEDLRKRARVPYGYRIEEGAAVINMPEAMVLTRYFELFLGGLPMSQAAKQAGLPGSATTLRHLFFRKEYAGTDFYPQIISKEYQEKLILEYESRKGRTFRTVQTHPPKCVRIYKDFQFIKQDADLPEDAAACAALLYQMIRPKTEYTKSMAPGR